MSWTNYWDQNSGDSMASPWGAYTSKFGQLSGQPNSTNSPYQVMPGQDDMAYAGGSRYFNEGGRAPYDVGGGGTNWMKALEMKQQPQTTAPTNPWIQPRQNNTRSQDWTGTAGGNTGMHPTLNNDAYKTDVKYGGYSTSPGHGGGYWDGGRPGAGSWVEPWLNNVEAPAAPAAAPTEMAQGAPAQIPQQTAPVPEYTPQVMEPIASWGRQMPVRNGGKFGGWSLESML